MGEHWSLTAAPFLHSKESAKLSSLPDCPHPKETVTTPKDHYPSQDWNTAQGSLRA